MWNNVAVMEGRTFHNPGIVKDWLLRTLTYLTKVGTNDHFWECLITCWLTGAKYGPIWLIIIGSKNWLADWLVGRFFERASQIYLSQYSVHQSRGILIRSSKSLEISDLRKLKCIVVRQLLSAENYLAVDNRKKSTLVSCHPENIYSHPRESHAVLAVWTEVLASR